MFIKESKFLHGGISPENDIMKMFLPLHDKSLCRCFTYTIYRDDTFLALRDIAVAIFHQNDISWWDLALLDLNRSMLSQL